MINAKEHLDNLNFSVQQAVEDGLMLSEAFARVVGEKLEERGIVENMNYGTIIKPGDSGSINGYGFNDDSGILYLLTSLYDENSVLVEIESSETTARLEGVVEILDYIRTGKHKAIPEGRTMRSLCDAISGILDTGGVKQVDVVLVTEQKVDGPRLPLDVKRRGFSRIKFTTSVYDIEDLAIEACPSDDTTAIELRPLDMGLEIPILLNTSSSGIQTLSMQVGGDLFADLYEREGSRLLQSNVRAYLKKKTSGANIEMKNTIRRKPEMFIQFNNGMSVTANAFEHEMRGGQPLLKSLSGVQVINGGQTMAVLHECKYSNKLSLANVAVAVKISIARADQDTVQAISRAANTQNTVQAHEFETNHPYLRRLAELSASTVTPHGDKHYFERMTSSYDIQRNYFKQKGEKALRKFDKEFPSKKVFKKPDIAYASMSWRGFPDDVCRGATAVFPRWMKQIATAGEPDATAYKEYVSLIIMRRCMERWIRDVMGRGELSSTYAAYAMAVLSDRLGDRTDLAMIWENQGLSKEFELMATDLLVKVRAEINSYAANRDGQTEVRQVAKKGDTWEHIKAQDFGITIAGIPEFTAESTDRHTANTSESEAA